MITKEFIDTIAKAYAASNPRKKGRWMMHENYPDPDKRGWRLWVATVSSHGGTPHPVCELSNCNARGEGHEDATLIAALYNAWPEIEKALRAHVRHTKRARARFSELIASTRHSNQPYGKCERCRTDGFWNCPKHKAKPRKTKTP